mmetsp:Transcript_35785/g.63867  ORF Transcript_35785/g.63867 Transcript_35785/m.63867 type:complete len:250 (+) Transcript_35785:807-1556(+)
MGPSRRHVPRLPPRIVLLLRPHLAQLSLKARVVVVLVHFKGEETQQHHKQHHSAAPNVRVAGVVVPIHLSLHHRLLRRHILRRPQHRHHTRVHAAPALGEPKVAQLQLWRRVRGEQGVVEFQVAVGDVIGVTKRDRVDKLSIKVARLRFRQHRPRPRSAGLAEPRGDVLSEGTAGGDLHSDCEVTIRENRIEGFHHRGALRAQPRLHCDLRFDATHRHVGDGPLYHLHRHLPPRRLLLHEVGISASTAP